MSAPRGGKDPNAELMRAMGSESGRYDPEPPEQWRWDLAHGSPKTRFRAWVKWKTTGHKDFETRSPFCVSEHGTPLTLEHAAVDLGWSIQYTREVAAEVERDGFVRLQKGGKIFNRADVPVSSEPAPGVRNEVVQPRWIPYLLDSIENLSPEKREIFEDIKGEFLKWEKVGFAEMMASWRLMVEQVELIMFERVGIEKKRLPKKERESPPVVQLSLLAIPGFVQNGDTESAIEFVQSAKPHRTKANKASHKPSPGRASLLGLEEDQESKRSVGRSVVEEDRPTDPIPFPTELRPDDNLVESIERVVEEHLAFLHEVPSLTLCRQIIDGLKGAPLDHLVAYVRPRIKKIHSLGILIDFAHSVGRAWQREAGARHRNLRRKWDTHSWDEPSIQQSARAALADPTTSEKDLMIAEQIMEYGRTGKLPEFEPEKGKGAHS